MKRRLISFLIAALIALVIAFAASAQRLGDLPTTTTITGNDFIPVSLVPNSSGSTRKATVGLIRGFNTYGTTGQLLRVNATGDGLEFFTPSFVPTSRTLTINGTTFDLTANRSWTIPSGITNSAAADEIMVSDGTNAIGRKVFSTANGNIRLGDSGLAGSRNIQVESSDANSDLILSSKGTGVLNFRHGTFSASRLTTDGSTVTNSIGNGGDYLRLLGNATTSSVISSSDLALGSFDDIIIQPANDLLFATGLGNIKLWETGGSVGGGSKVILIGNAATNPTTNPVNSGILYADASDGSKLKWRVPAGTVFDLTQGSITDGGNATNANFTAAVNTVYYLPAATLTANRTITIPTGSNMDVIEFYNNETGFTWNLGGELVYLSDNVTTVSSLLANTNYIIRRVNGRWRVAN